MTGEVLKQFLVGIGFGVDDKSFKSAMSFIGNVTTKVTLLAGAVKAAAAGAFYGISKISEGFEEMGYQYRIIAPAINKAIILRRALTSAYKEAGINMVQAVQQSVKFNMSLAKTKFQIEGIVKSTALKFMPMLTKQMEATRAKISANMPKILATLEKFVKFIFKAFEGVVLLGTRLWSIFSRVWNFLEKLDGITGGWSTKILAVIAAWRLLNLAFLTTPVGMILTGLLALLMLFDDFKTWEEGGESLFDWSVWVPAIKAFIEVVKSAWEGIKQMWGVVLSLVGAFKKLFSGDFKGFFSGIYDSAMKVLGVLKQIVDYWGKVFSFGKTFASGAFDALSGLFGSTPALGSNTTNANSQSVNQNTVINVNGVNDPQAAARTVGNEQSKVNFNMVRNMKGAAR